MDYRLIIAMGKPQNMIFSTIKKGIKILLFTLLLFSFIPANSFAQKGLMCTVKLIVRKGSTEGSKIILFKNGNKIQELPVKKSGGFDVMLDYGNDSILSFEKDRYVSKKININTVVPIFTLRMLIIQLILMLNFSLKRMVLT